METEEKEPVTTDIYTIKTSKKYLPLFIKQKFDPSKNIGLIDISYMIFYKFFALRNWYHKAHPDQDIPDDYDWLADEVFMTKYKKLFFDNITTICKKKNINISNIVFAIDCKHTSIWRNREQNSYKITRKESHNKSKFYSYKIFGIVIDQILPKIVEKYGCHIIKHNECEADDVIANCILNLNADSEDNSNFKLEYINKIKDNKRKIYIIATDTDYIQICNSNVILMDSKCKELNDNYLTSTVNNVKYLMTKILYGDVSDNITFCSIKKSFLDDKDFKCKYTDEYVKCTKTLSKNMIDNIGIHSYLHNSIENIRKKKEDLYKNQLDKNGKEKESSGINIDKIDDGPCKLCPPVKNSQFVKNLIMIDFRMIPDYLKKSLDEKIKSTLGL